MKRQWAVVGAVLVAVFIISGEVAGAATASAVVQTPLLVAGSAALQGSDGSAAQLSIIGYVAQSGAVHTEVSICGGTCSHYEGDGGRITFSTLGPTAKLITSVSGIGNIDISFTAVATNSLVYECVDSNSTIAVHGNDVEQSVVSGDLGLTPTGVATWHIVQSRCGVWARQASIEYSAS